MKMNDFNMNEPDEIDVATNRILVESMISKKAWDELNTLGDEDVRVALESLIVTGLVTETDGTYRLTELGSKAVADEQE
jgi:hypothetical protein